MTNFLLENGMPLYAITWIFMLPIAATLIVMGRQIVGIKGFGLAMPLLLGFAFAATGIRLGLSMLLVVVVSAYIIRSILGNFRLLYLPKTALIITGSALILMFIAPFLPYKDNLQFPMATFSFLLIILSLEQFYAFLSERGLRKTVGITIETLSLSVIIYFLLTSVAVQGIVIEYPAFTLIAVIVINLFLGRWTGLRLSEYIRFKDVIFKQ